MTNHMSLHVLRHTEEMPDLQATHHGSPAGQDCQDQGEQPDPIEDRFAGHQFMAKHWDSIWSGVLLSGLLSEHVTHLPSCSST